MYLASAVNSSRTSFELPSHGPSGLNGNAGLGADHHTTLPLLFQQTFKGR